MPRFFIKAPDFKSRPLLFIDFEMTGLDPAVHEIIEVAALVVYPPKFEIKNSYYTKVIPTHIASADAQALQITDYDSKNWQDAIPLHQMLQELSDLASECILAGWVVQNEWNFLIAALDQEKLPYFFDEKLLEVWSLAYTKLYTNPNILRLNATNAAKHFGISIELHKPDSDIRATYEIFKRLIT